MGVECGNAVVVGGWVRLLWEVQGDREKGGRRCGRVGCVGEIENKGDGVGKG